MALNEMDARLISQGSETTAIGSSALVSVSDGEGQPQKNITLGNFADSMGAAVPQQQNAGQVGITGLYARTSEGKMVELTKESVASVMGNLLYGADNASSLASVVAGHKPFLNLFGAVSADGKGFKSLDDIDFNGVMYASVSYGLTNMPFSYCMVMTFINGPYGMQIAISVDNNEMAFRGKVAGNWNTWNKVSATEI